MKRIDLKNIKVSYNEGSRYFTLHRLYRTKHELHSAIIRFIVSQNRNKMKGQN